MNAINSLFNIAERESITQTSNVIGNTATGAQSVVGIIGVLAATGVAASAPPVLPGIICVCILTRMIITQAKKRSRLFSLLIDVNKIVEQLAITLSLMTTKGIIENEDPIYTSLQTKIELLLIYVLSITDKPDIENLQKILFDYNDKIVSQLKTAISNELKIRNSFLKSTQSALIGYNVKERAYGSRFLNAQDFRTEITIMLTVINSYYTQLYNHALLKMIDNDEKRKEFLAEEMKLHKKIDLQITEQEIHVPNSLGGHKTRRQIKRCKIIRSFTRVNNKRKKSKK